MGPDLQVDRAATRAYYCKIHSNLAGHIADLSEQIRDLKAELVVSNAGYIAIEAASAARVPTCLVCSLSWDELLLSLLPDEIGQSRIIAEIVRGYEKADLCFRLAPRMPMPAIRGVDLAAAIGMRGKNIRDALLDYFPSKPTSIVLLAFGDWDVARPPALETRSDVLFLVPERWKSASGDVMGVDDLPFPFRDILASVDLVVSKSGYGIVTELALDGRASLLLERADWPEEPYLLRWLGRYAPFEQLSAMADLTLERVRDSLRGARALAPLEPALGGGELQIARAILERLNS
ncbi:hypothetical protein [Sabulicella glaciei]|uniref:Glycosyl transferase family 28 C-terminal domain-containing protein n=1 Tax=Sabulicella glaciei TaxID=2984948 RepID=A0ABT3NZC7_9PROT|nr:hypothetical protein [Roseococcus sp. MDT2-1-1]MCW8087510.1 hypothetical protein [Roseococcus sp. MDT2-1-1]